MKKIKYIIILIMTFTICFVGCSDSINDKLLNDSSEYNSNTEYPIIYIHPDWPAYSTSESVIEAATNIFSGTVTDISFEIVDMLSGKADRSPDSKSTSRMIYTIYTVAILDGFKGENKGDVKICKIGGMENYNAKEQYDLLQNSNLWNTYNAIPISDDGRKLIIGDKYLFCIARTGGDFAYIINPTQFAYAIDSNEAKDIIKAITK